jgi:tetratricopeptide (TPR) repeat protein
MVKRVRLFKWISAILPLVALCLLELLLRLAHYGHDLNLFITYPPDHRYLVLSPDASRRYFADPALATTGNIEPFLKEKEAGVLRIFVLGESTTIGYPYLHNGSFHRWLQYRLMRSLPGQKVEIINLSLTAVNSYTVLGFARELADYQPDAVLIYTGHNEYYGALGVGSTEGVGGNPLVVRMVLWLRGLRVFQLCSRALGWFRKKDNFSAKTRMELMVRDEQIPYGSRLYTRGIEQFTRNMEATLSFLNNRHIPVFLSNLVSNEKDLKPFISGTSGNPTFQNEFDLGARALAERDSTTAYAHFVAANRVFGGNALCNYYLGRIAYGRGDTAGAKVCLDKARDLDELRFRAPDTLNDIITRLCKQYPNAHLVDTRAAFEGASKGHIIGEEVILEHVHPNLAGYALMSDAFYLALKAQGVLRIPPQEEMSFSGLLATMPVTRTDSLLGAYRVLNLKSAWPFSQGLPKDSLKVVTEEEELAFNMAFRHMPWSNAMNDLYDYYVKEHDLKSARGVMEGLVLEHPTEAAYYEKTGNVCGEMKDLPDAVFYFSKAFDLMPSFEKARYLFVMDLQLDRPGDALTYLDYAIHNNPGNMNLAPVRYYTQQVIQLQQAYAKDSSDISLLERIAGAYAKMGNKEGASKYTEMATAKGRGAL